MDDIFVSYLHKLQFGQKQVYKNITILPLVVEINGGPEYLILDEAIDQKAITITEVSDSGSVPELKVINTAAIPILLLDGEELRGAKQNRVLNTSIFLAGNSETVIPVSCTERGRWAYVSETFASSPHIMAHSGRAKKASKVTASLRMDRGPAADQAEVWEDIEILHSRAGTDSPTRAMMDVYTAKDKDLKGYVDAFKYVSGQKGALFFINEKPAGMDVLSRAEKYEKLHQKFVRSYAIEALLRESSSKDRPAVKIAKDFFDEARKCKQEVFDSVSLGKDYRFEGEDLVGSALVFEKNIIHLAFFASEKSERSSGMSSMRDRVGFRNNRE